MPGLSWKYFFILIVWDLYHDKILCYHTFFYKYHKWLFHWRKQLGNVCQCNVNYLLIWKFFNKLINLPAFPDSLANYFNYFLITTVCLYISWFGSTLAFCGTNWLRRDIAALKKFTQSHILLIFPVSPYAVSDFNQQIRHANDVSSTHR
jgi:hypothetical protein